MKTNKAYLLLGSNIGDSLDILSNARDVIQIKIGSIVHSSTIYETEAWGKQDQPNFLNQVLEVDTVLSAFDLLGKCLEIEDQLGRVRFEKWSQRTIDIDILYFNNEIIHSKLLQVPHPEIQNRKFTLIPMAELAPTLVHPKLNKTQQELLESCSDPLEVKKVNL